MAKRLKVAKGALALAAALKRRMGNHRPPFSAVALAKKARCSVNTMHRVLGGYGNPSLSTVEDLAAALDCEAWELIKEKL